MNAAIVRLLKNEYVPFLFAVPLFFFLYQYKGIVMDAVLYVTQYVYSVNPERFAGDPAFAYGNQDSLGFFSPILGLFIKSLGVNKGMFFFTALMHLGWVGASVFMLKSLAKLTRNRFWILPITILFVLLFANAMPIGKVRFFYFAECYACSRTLSIVLAISALALMCSCKKWMSLVFILLGSVVHPLTAGWCLPLWLFYYYPRMRWPIVICSALFPLTFFLHTGKLDLYSEDWMLRPLEYTPSYATVGRFGSLLVFWAFAVKSFSRNNLVLKLSKSMTWVLLIALYWDCWGGFGEHVLLYQSQPWRAVWLGAILAVPLLLLFLKDSVLRIYRTKKVSSLDLALLLVGINLLSSQPLIVVMVGSIVLLKQKPKIVHERDFLYAFLAFIVMGLFIQQYHIWCLQGFKSFFGYDFHTLCHMRDAALYEQFCLSAVLVVYYLKKRKFLFMAILLLYCVFPQYQLLPLLVIFMRLYRPRSKMQYWGFSFVILLAVLADSLFNSDFRMHKQLNGFPLESWRIALIFLASMFVIYLCRYTKLVMALFLIVVGATAAVAYDGRNDERKKAESALDGYVEQTVFPQVRERGRILFYVGGALRYEPRLQFMTGSYLSLSSHVGSLFNEQHYKDVKNRYEQIEFEQVDESTFTGVVYQRFVESILSNQDSLVNRTELLCRKREISHLVTIFSDLPFALLDSTTLKNGTNAYLYACP